MLFKDYHIPMIRSGSKTATRREWDENYAGPSVGSVVAATTELFVSLEDADCFIRITDRYRQRLEEMTEEDAMAEGDYLDLYDFKQAYEDVYGEGSFDPWKEVEVVEFEYVGKTFYECGDCGDRVGRKEGVRDMTTHTYYHPDCIERLTATASAK